MEYLRWQNTYIVSDSSSRGLFLIIQLESSPVTLELFQFRGDAFPLTLGK